MTSSFLLGSVALAAGLALGGCGGGGSSATLEVQPDPAPAAPAAPAEAAPQKTACVAAVPSTATCYAGVDS